MTGDVKGTERSYRQAIEIQERLFQEHSSVVEFQEDLAKTCTDLGMLLAPIDKPEAARWYQRAIDIQEPLVRTHPQVVPFQQDLARSYSVLGMLQTESGLTSVAMPSLERAITIQRRLVRDHPKVPENGPDLSSTDINMGKLHKKLGQPAEALKDWQDAVRLIESFPEPGPYDLYNLASAYALSSTVIDWAKARSQPERETLSGQLLDKAMEALRRSVAAGWSDAQQMEADDDLKPLRSRVEFQKVVKSIQKKR
jgi:tetratricopeptide (TPR) repeat protein